MHGKGEFYISRVMTGLGVKGHNILARGEFYNISNMYGIKGFRLEKLKVYWEYHFASFVLLLLRGYCVGGIGYDSSKRI
jgi:hypothetical protein